VVTEFQLSEISHDVGTCWRYLGPTLRIANAKLCNLDEECRTNWEKAYKLLMMWKEEKGSNALVGRLADHLKEIGRTSIAEKLLGKQAILESGWTLHLSRQLKGCFWRMKQYRIYPCISWPPILELQWLFIFLGKTFLEKSRIFFQVRYNDTENLSWTFSDLSFWPM